MLWHGHIGQRSVGILTSIALLALAAEGHAQGAPEEFVMSGVARPTSAPRASTEMSFSAVDQFSLRTWDAQIARWLRSDDLRLTRVRADTLLADRTHERFTQYYQGIPVFGGEITRQLAEGQSLTSFGVIYPGIDLDTTPTVSPDRARTILTQLTGAEISNSLDLVVLPQTQSVVLPRTQSLYALAYTTDIWTRFDVIKYFVDAHTGVILDSFSNLKRQMSPETGTGLAGDTKKLSVTHRSDWGVSVAQDRRRPAAIETYDLGFDWQRGIWAMFENQSLPSGKLASSPGNTWTDAVAVDTHAYMGWTYDYLYDRFGLQGLDGYNRPIRALIHLVNKDLLWSYPEGALDFLCGAFYYKDTIAIGDGFPPPYDCNPLASLDIVAHELAHGVIRHSSDLIYKNESGALNEAFADILGLGAEAYHQKKGSGLPYSSNWVQGDHVFEAGLRDLSDPESIDYSPDHYDDRRIGSWDDGWLHINSLIPGHAFYRAVLHSGNRERVEDAFFRAFVHLLPNNATMQMAALATVQAASTSVKTAIRNAWREVGIDDRRPPHGVKTSLDLFRSNRWRCDGNRHSRNLFFEISLSTGSEAVRLSNHGGSVFSQENKQVTGFHSVAVGDDWGQTYVPPYTSLVKTNWCWSASRVDYITDGWMRYQIRGDTARGEAWKASSGRYRIPAP